MKSQILVLLLGGAVAAARPSPAPAPPAAARAGDPKLEWIAKADAPAPKLPEKIPEAFAKLLEPRGMRLLDGEGKALCELYLRKEIPFAEKPTTQMRVDFKSLPVGTFVGALNVTAPMIDYRNQKVAPGCYGLRVGWQPDDGDHLGTSDSRDFLVLTDFAHEKDAEPVTKLEDLADLSVPVSSTQHLLTLYLALPEGDAPKEGALRLYQRADREEWAADLTLIGRAPDAKETTKLRVGLVLIGHISE